MAKLNEFIGKLMAEFGQARASADLESVKIAQFYAKDNLLKHFSIPRFRAQQIDLTIPAALEPASLQQQYEPLDTGKFNKTAYQAALDEAEAFGFNEAVASDIQQQIERFTAELELELNEGKYEAEVFNERLKSLSANIVDLLSKGDEAASRKIESKGRNNFIVNLTTRLQKYLTPYIKPKSGTEANDPASFDLIVEAARLRELPVTSLIQIKMTITEEGMEWNVENKDGKTISRLVPE